MRRASESRMRSHAARTCGGRVSVVPLREVRVDGMRPREALAAKRAGVPGRVLVHVGPPPGGVVHHAWEVVVRLRAAASPAMLRYARVNERIWGRLLRLEGSGHAVAPSPRRSMTRRAKSPS
jgi:hypothetical protein